MNQKIESLADLYAQVHRRKQRAARTMKIMGSLLLIAVLACMYGLILAPLHP